MTTHFKLAEHAQLIIFARSPEKKWVHENVSFRSVYNGQLRLCMSLLCAVTLQTKRNMNSFYYFIAKIQSLGDCELMNNITS